MELSFLVQNMDIGALQKASIEVFRYEVSSLPQQ